MDTLFLILSKSVWVFLRPETQLVMIFALALVLLWFNRVRAARITLTIALGITLLIGLLPIGNLLLTPLERGYPANTSVAAPAGIIVLGGMEEIPPPHAGYVAQVNGAGERIIETMELSLRFPEAKVLFAGGKTVLTPLQSGEFSIGPDLLRRLGLPDDRLIVEDRSRTTAENAVLSREIVPDQGTGNWLLVTSAWHMPRALGTFCAAGWRNLVPYPVDYRGGPLFDEMVWRPARHMQGLNLAVKEWIGLLAYRMTGRTQAFMPTRCDA